ncbi:cAMP-dependent protein kinase catalytic subunit beta [Eumeta japonica]|uniref:cAMP-dependent protein kinase catalytic subunit beta n=1 Tax=Eumeta variegata TaxID=151549 RepID=A0A4C1T096_EUMVA|nr:cAMP-dependent protein kinase catalytic subunit beta [Eumeta japonica]
MAEDVKEASTSQLSTGYSAAKQEEYNIYLKKITSLFHQKIAKKMDSSAKLTDFERRTILGTGAYGVVYLVKHIGAENYYAMKALEKAKIVKLKQIEHTYNEKTILCGLDFPFVVHMKYFFKDNVYIYFVMPFIGGGEMFFHLRNESKFNENYAKFYASQVLLALEYLHACSLVYRDLKPENILIDRVGYTKLTDFGFCKFLHGRTWTLCGTPEYLAPEIILSKGYGTTVDWWSFGVLIYEMCAGYPPFFASEPMKVYEKIVTGKYRNPAHFSPALIDLLSHTLVLDVTRRFGNLKNGMLDFKNHKWFSEINWDHIFNGRTPAPFVPKTDSPGDTQQFDLYDTEKIKECSFCMFEKEFKDF